MSDEADAIESLRREMRGLRRMTFITVAALVVVLIAGGLWVNRRMDRGFLTATGDSHEQPVHHG